MVLKDLHTQYRFVYPSQSKDADAQSSVDGLNHFIGPKDDVQVVYIDNSPELIRAIKDLGYRHQTSIENVDSSKSFADREVRQMLEGASSNLPGLPLKRWPLAMQHHAAAINASPQLDGSESPWQLRFGEDVPAMRVPFGAKQSVVLEQSQKGRRDKVVCNKVVCDRVVGVRGGGGGGGGRRTRLGGADLKTRTPHNFVGNYHLRV